MSEWQETSRWSDVFVVKHKGDIIAAHVVLSDYPKRARLLFSAHDQLSRSISGALNRLLHWYEICHYKNMGIDYYDFGGIVPDQKFPLYSITQFKLSFGGTILRENTLYIAKNPLVRFTLRQLLVMRRATMIMLNKNLLRILRNRLY